MDLIEPRFREEIVKFRKLLRSQTRALTVEGVHDLRVSTRRLRAQVALIEKSTVHHLLQRSQNTLKKLGRALGERRQWDVTLKEAHKFHLIEKDLQRQKLMAGRELKKVLKCPEVKALPQDLAQFEQTLQNEKIHVAPKELKKMRSELKAWLKQKKFSSKKLHELRISTKKIRYAFECMGLPVEDLKDLQDHLGKSHDLTVLRDYFDDPKPVRKADRKERRRAKARVRPALSTSLEVLEMLS